jgi:hypothetical protein
MALSDQIQYVSDENGVVVSVIVPIELWREISSEPGLAHLLSNSVVSQEVGDAKNQQITLNLNKVYASQSSRLDPILDEMQRMTIKRSDGDDGW